MAVARTPVKTGRTISALVIQSKLFNNSSDTNKITAEDVTFAIIPLWITLFISMSLLVFLTIHLYGLIIFKDSMFGKNKRKCPHCDSVEIRRTDVNNGRPFQNDFNEDYIHLQFTVKCEKCGYSFNCLGTKKNE